MLSNPRAKYQQVAVQTATPSQLLLMLYDGAIRFLKQATDALERRDYEKVNTNLIKTQAIIHELMGTLNHSYPISKQLASIYEYMLYQLIQGNHKKSANHLNEVMGYLVELKDTWAQASKKAAPPSPVLGNSTNG